VGLTDGSAFTPPRCSTVLSLFPLLRGLHASGNERREQVEKDGHGRHKLEHMASKLGDDGSARNKCSNFGGITQGTQGTQARYARGIN
jgi:hypothetical protein